MNDRMKSRRVIFTSRAIYYLNTALLITMADNKRYFRNKAVTSTSTPASSDKNCPPQPQWDSETCTNVARQLMKKCLDHYEGQPVTTESPKKKGSTSTIQTSPVTSSKSSSSLGTLYDGALGARVYLRMRMAQHYKETQQVADQKPAAKKTRSSNRLPNDSKIQALLQDALKIAEEAVEIESERMDRHTIRVTLLEGPYVGAKVMVAALYHHLGQESKSREEGSELLEFLVEHTNAMPAKECEVLYGRAGALQAILFLRQEFNEGDFGSEEAVVLGQAIVNEGLKVAAEASDSSSNDSSDTKQLPLLWEWHGKRYLGAAHGVVGILNCLLCLNKSELEQITLDKNKGDLESLIKDTIRALDSYCWPESGNLRSSMESSASHDKLVHWCHGAPGHVLLLVKASEVFQDTSFLDRAREIGTKVIWPRGLLRKGVGLCHGITGNAYSLLALGRPHKRIKDDDEGNMVWMRQACHYAAFSLEKWTSLESVPDNPYSVFEGAGGLAILMMDLGTINHKNNNSDEDPTVRDGRFPLYDF